MIMWLGRNANGTLVVSLLKLERERNDEERGGRWVAWSYSNNKCFWLIDDIPEFEYLTWEDNPIEVTLIKLNQ